MEIPDHWLVHAILLAGGVGVLAAGGEALIRGATRLARTLGVSTLFIGLTLVAFGTSAPEAAVTIFAGAAGASDLAVGNVVGSNIANILLILGIAALVTPLRVSRSLVRVDGPIMILVMALFLALAGLHREFGRVTGACFLAGLVLYTTFTYVLARVTGPPPDEQLAPPAGRVRRRGTNVLLVVLGVVGLVVGARLIVDGASGLATMWGVSQHIIGLTIVAVGTSLPELAATIAAARHKQPDIAVGNVVGSNIFNVLFVTGAAAVVHPLPMPEAIIWFDGPVMLAICVVFYPMAYFGGSISRWEGVILLGSYAAYLAWTVLHMAS